MSVESVSIMGDTYKPVKVGGTSKYQNVSTGEYIEISYIQEQLAKYQTDENSLADMAFDDLSASVSGSEEANNNTVFANGSGGTTNNTVFASGNGQVNNNTVFANGSGGTTNNTTFASGNGQVNNNTVFANGNGGTTNNTVFASGSGQSHNYVTFVSGSAASGKTVTFVSGSDGSNTVSFCQGTGSNIGGSSGYSGISTNKSEDFYAKAEIIAITVHTCLLNSKIKDNDTLNEALYGLSADEGKAVMDAYSDLFGEDLTEKLEEYAGSKNKDRIELLTGYLNGATSTYGKFDSTDIEDLWVDAFYKAGEGRKYTDEIAMTKLLNMFNDENSLEYDSLNDKYQKKSSKFDIAGVVYDECDGEDETEEANMKNALTSAQDENNKKAKKEYVEQNKDTITAKSHESIELDDKSAKAKIVAMTAHTLIDAGNGTALETILGGYNKDEVRLIESSFKSLYGIGIEDYIDNNLNSESTYISKWIAGKWGNAVSANKLEGADINTLWATAYNYAGEDRDGTDEIVMAGLLEMLGEEGNSLTYDSANDAYKELGTKQGDIASAAENENDGDTIEEKAVISALEKAQNTKTQKKKDIYIALANDGDEDDIETLTKLIRKDSRITNSVFRNRNKELAKLELFTKTPAIIQDYLAYYLKNKHDIDVSEIKFENSTGNTISTTQTYTCDNGKIEVKFSDDFSTIQKITIKNENDTVLETIQISN